MSTESDTQITMKESHKLVLHLMSIDTCKECTFAQIINGDLSCTNFDPCIRTCNVVKIIYNI